MHPIKQKPLLFVIRFGLKGFSAVSSTFRHWFERSFCKKLMKEPNVKICVVSQCKLESLGIVDMHRIEKIEDLHYSELIKEKDDYFPEYMGFCDGVIDPDTNMVPYEEHKRKMTAKIRRDKRVL